MADRLPCSIWIRSLTKDQHARNLNPTAIWSHQEIEIMEIDAE